MQLKICTFLILSSAENRSNIGPQLPQFCFQHRLNLDIQNILNSLRKDFQVTYLEVTLVSMVKVNGGEAKKICPIIYFFMLVLYVNRYNYKIKLPACSDTKPNLNITVGAIPK